MDDNELKLYISNEEREKMNAVADDVNEKLAKNIFGKMKYKEEVRKNKKEVQARFDASGHIHNHVHNAGIPSRLNIAVLYFNVGYAMYVEGILQENLWRLQGRRF